MLFRPKHLHAKFEEPREVLKNSDAKSEDIIRFVDEKHIGLVGQMTPSNEASFAKPAVAAYFDIDWKRNPKVPYFSHTIVFWRNNVYQY